MKKSSPKRLLLIALIPLAFHVSESWSAISLDRTRIIFSSSSKSVSLTVTNKNNQLPYLAQGWIENIKGEKITTPFAVLPPVQRLEPEKTSQVRIEALPEIKALPKDRETLFYFNLREIPPKSDKPNVLQLALQSKIKLFYRPIEITPSVSDIMNNPWQEKLVILKKADNYILNNTTPFYVTIIGATRKDGSRVSNNFEAVLVPPFENAPLGLSINQLGNDPKLTYINDYGGRIEMKFTCTSDKCTTAK
ncbi:fimbria/pilus periplasmic chaperone [Proteus faecis]|uniref:fimbria/pilus periplasmic chaperone n=1 Tax=Proteus faecis TaxID=2050967 RepID=UPI00301DF69F